jgi:hypothetical protein
VLDGQFAVREFEGNRVFELPGTPLETYGVLFGPAARHGQSVYARVHSTHRGRRFPAFAVSLGGVSGFRLEVAAAKQTLELLQGEQTIETVPWEWASGAWTHLRLQIRQLSDAVMDCRRQSLDPRHTRTFGLDHHADAIGRTDPRKIGDLGQTVFRHSDPVR